MRYLALAVDYEGTAASHDELAESAPLAIERLPISGRRSAMERIERRADLSPDQSRHLVRELVSARYTLPE